MHKMKTKQLKQEFKDRSNKWRIEAVIHDGNWYDFKKWLRVSKATEEELQQWIEDNEDILIKSDESSYRVSYHEIVRWYEQEELDIEDSIVPSNFPPKMWGETTETDAFLSAPRRRVGTVSFMIEDEKILKRCVEILRGTAKVMPDKAGRYKAFGLSALHMKNLLSKGLTTKQFDSLEVKTRAILMQRELIDLPDEWLSQALSFYAETFAPTALKSSMSTISIYLKDRGEIDSQTLIWTINAMKKFDETASVPFSGYISNVLRHWPYDLPDEFLGKELSKFQRERRKAITEAEKDSEAGKNVDIEVLAGLMEMPLSEYVELSNEHDTWMAERNATTLTWQDSSNEKKGTLIGKEVTPAQDRGKMARLSLATVKAAVDTGDWVSAQMIISNIDESDIDSSIGEKMSKEFIVSFGAYLTEIENE